MTFGHGTFDINAFSVSHKVTKKAEAGSDVDFSGYKVKMWQHCKDDDSFSSGWKKEFGEGEYDVATGDFVNDDASALWIPEGYRVTVNQHSNTDSNFPGTTKTFEGPLQISCLVDEGFNDDISNIVVEKIVEPKEPNEEGKDCLEMFDEHKNKSLYPNMGASDLFKPDKRLQFTGVGQCACECLADPDCVAFHIATDHSKSEHIDKCWFWSKDVANDTAYVKESDDRPPTSVLGRGDEGQDGRGTNSYILKPWTKVQEILTSREEIVFTPQSTTVTQQTANPNMPLIIGGVATLGVLLMVAMRKK